MVDQSCEFQTRDKTSNGSQNEDDLFLKELERENKALEMEL
jgi:hypothetical protein